MNTLASIIISFTAGIMGAIFFLMLSSNLHGTAIGVMDLSLLINNHIQEYGSYEMSNEERVNISKAFANALSRSISDVSDEHQVVLINNNAVITDVSDYTSLISERIKSAMDEQ